jgi:hypothetical protein
MDNLNYFQRLRHLIFGGLEAGTAIAFVLITISVSFNVLIQYTYDPAPDRLAYANILWYGLLVVNFLVFLLGVIIMGLISSFVKPRGNFEPIFLGLTVGISMVLAIDYLIYLTDDPYSIDSFPQHLFMFNPDWPWQSFFAPYLVPNLINVGVLAYVSWKTTRLEMIKPRRRISYISVILVVCMLHTYGDPKREYSFEYFNFYQVLKAMGHEVELFDYMGEIQAHGKAVEGVVAGPATAP